MKTTYNFLEAEIKRNWTIVLQDCPTGFYFFLVQKGRKGIVRTLAEVSLKQWDAKTLQPAFNRVVKFAKEFDYVCVPSRLPYYGKLMEEGISHNFAIKHQKQLA
jgi:hypothetical protein